MRTLFLLGIMFFLWVIAIKEPNQSAWDAARVIGSKVDRAVSMIKEKSISTASGPASKGKARDIAADFNPGIGKNKSAGIPKIKTAKPVRPKISVAPPTIVEKMPRSTVASLPMIPAVPVAPVKVAEIGAAAPPIPDPAPPVSIKPAPVWKYEEVKSFYENASRLLAEIK